MQSCTFLALNLTRTSQSLTRVARSLQSFSRTFSCFKILNSEKNDWQKQMATLTSDLTDAHAMRSASNVEMDGLRRTIQSLQQQLASKVNNFELLSIGIYVSLNLLIKSSIKFWHFLSN